MPVVLDTAQLNTEQDHTLDNGLYSLPPRHSVGQLDKLPLQVLTEILLALDVPTLIAFRRVNPRAMMVIDSIYQYRMVLKHYPNVVPTITGINATTFDFRALFETLFPIVNATKCTMCNDLGDYIYSITCELVCFSCLTSKSNSNHLPVVSRYVAQQTGFKRRSPYISSLRQGTILYDQPSMVKRLRPSLIRFAYLDDSSTAHSRAE
ncbi:hypothetical protein F4679DRAFT_598432 [Xylaria curta]|nr:hypothetical protein F4679DRAFT_598432 [Xylaria curta]